MLFFNVLLNNELGYKLFFEFETNAYKNKNLEINFWNKIYFGRNDFKYISPSHFSYITFITVKMVLTKMLMIIGDGT